MITRSSAMVSACSLTASPTCWLLAKPPTARKPCVKPDVVVMDLSMPELNGLQATEQLTTTFPRMKVVALTAHEDECYLSQLCKAGAAGYVLKRSAGDELIQ